jgi:hypothetical protein
MLSIAIKREFTERRDMLTEGAERADMDAATFLLRHQRQVALAAEMRSQASEYQRLLHTMEFEPEPVETLVVDGRVVNADFDPYCGRN